MRKNFTVNQENAVLCDGVLFDLHNHYAVDSITLTGKSLRITFAPDHTHGAGLPPVAILCPSIQHYEVTSEGELASAEHLDRIGYAAPGQIDLDTLLSESQSDPACHLVLDFVVCAIRFHGDDCTFAAEPGATTDL